MCRGEDQSLGDGIVLDASPGTASLLTLSKFMFLFCPSCLTSEVGGLMGLPARSCGESA